MRISKRIVAIMLVAIIMTSLCSFVNAGAGYQEDLYYYLANQPHVILGKTYLATPEQAKVLADYLVNAGSKDFPDANTKAAKDLIEEAIAMVNATGAASLQDLPADVKANAVAKVQQAAKQVGVDLQVDTSTMSYKAIADGKVLISGQADGTSVTGIALEGQNQTYNRTDNNELVFRFNTDYAYFQNGGKVYIDGKELSTSDYTSKSGSTIIAVKAEYAKKLDVGAHTIEVAYTNGTRSRANFTVVHLAGGGPAPAGDGAAQGTVGAAFVYTGSNNMFAVALSVIAVVAVSTTFFKKVYAK